MKKNSTSRSAFFNLRVLIGLFIVLTGICLALIGFGTFSGLTANSVQAQQKPKIINVPGLPPGFDCATIYDKGIHKMEGFRAGLIMIACGEARGGSAWPYGRFSSQLLDQAIAPLTYGGPDVDLVTGTETSPHIIQSETFSTANPDNPDQIVVCYNDSRGAAGSNFSGCSTSTDGGTTFTRLTTGSGQSPFTNTFGDPVILYNKPTGTWFTVWLDANGSCTLGGYKSTTPEDPNSWTHHCVHSNGGDDRESGWADNNPSSPHFGNMYVSWNDFGVGGGALQVRVSTDNGNTWTQRGITNNFIRNVQITGDAATGDVYIAGMDEGGGGFPHNDTNKIFRSTDGGNTWTNTYTGTPFPGPGSQVCSDNPYFSCMFPDQGGFWRHEGWGEPAVLNGVVHLVYSQHGSGADTGDVYYIRSTDAGVTFSAPFKLNSDSTTRPQWQANISVSDLGTVFAMWYDARESSSCQKGNPAVPCYRMWARKSTDNGATWLADMEFSDVVSPLPGQSDPNIVTGYAGDYDYGSALLTKHVTSWDDGRVTISNQSQQNTFFDQEPAGGGTPSPTPTASPSATATATASPTATPASCGWAPGPDLPFAGTRFGGVFFPGNGKLYAMGGRDVNNVEFIHPFEYDPVSNTWSTKAASYPDSFVSNIECAVANDSGTDYIYCVGGSSFATQTAIGRVFRYDPVADSLTVVPANWPPGDANILPGGISVFNNKIFILGGFNVNTSTSNEIWEFTPNPAGWVQKSAVLPVPRAYIPTTTIGSFIYTGGGADWDPVGQTLVDTTDSFKYDPVADSITTIPAIPRPVSNTRALNFCNQMYVIGGAFVAISNEVDIYDPVSNTWSLGQPFINPRRNAATDTDGTNNIWLAGGYDASLAIIASTEIFNCPVSPCGSASPTPTATATATPTATATATTTATATPTATTTATATATPTSTIRPTPTPRAKPTPRPAPTPGPRPTVKPSPWPPPSPTP